MRKVLALIALTVVTASGLQVSQTDSADAATSLTTRRTQIDKLTDEARKKAGCKPLRISERLNTSAQRHAKDMSKHKFLGHTSSNGTTWIKRIKAAGYPYPGAENIAYGRTSASAVMKAWLASPAHKKNITNCAFTRVGIGYVASGNYWVQDFGY